MTPFNLKVLEHLPNKLLTTALTSVALWNHLLSIIKITLLVIITPLSLNITMTLQRCHLLQWFPCSKTC